MRHEVRKDSRNELLLLHRVCEAPTFHQGPQLLNNLLLARGRAPNGQIATALKVWIPVSRVGRSDDSAGFLENDPAGTNVPDPDTGLPEDIDPAGSDIAEVKGCRPRAAYRVHHGTAVGLRGEKLLVHRGTQLPVWTTALVSPLNSDQAVIKRSDGGGITLRGQQKAAAVISSEESTFALDSSEEVTAEGVVDDTNNRLAADSQSERDGGIGETVDEVQGAVDGVGDDGGGVGKLGSLFEALFAEELELGICGGDGLGDHVLDSLVGRGDTVAGVVLGV